METTQHIEKRTMEYARILSKEKTLSKDKSLNGWEAPEEGCIKLNPSSRLNSIPPLELKWTNETFVLDEIFKYLRQWVHTTNEGKEAIQCSQ